MRLGRALFAVVVSFFVSTASLSVARELAHSKDSTLLSSHPIIGHGGAEGRSLRAVGTENDSSELRGFWGYAKALWWADWGVSEDYVMKALKLKG
ncbi:hypothetical protein PHYSODRAFT_288665 [Phytophthora sojae]|uniref:RxLR effector protein n=2 Tax=Phytophthora sojae TaxID=67593 RepID=G5A6P8_PHYSP|nr:hypothetical protein PHYSODRAFT_288662 [Phytophthora sojae]XP_009535641.1 hypothetical protein PHYSODRAFT_288665 [Phytophthora sojae]AEK81114.1 Avh290a1 [Phytophthora sojae]AEK81115.1 Avh290a1 [Phytophthora sojae]AEK81116.1 Avh290a1 [Phytophthora sojae]EGZ09003.1 hypothetical protein PHYSODRAFT_288662 [Phytophthora sojae]EGZ09008.1 hypothetical protein PHYSODRAFT_288665 [Phytophthora sojae]|eukprot:XP_009535636.1 hypothetical protein PHYSODRAFT_288662 [Phytophthora sojae]